MNDLKYHMYHTMCDPVGNRSYSGPHLLHLLFCIPRVGSELCNKTLGADEASCFMRLKAAITFEQNRINWRISIGVVKPP